MQRFVLLIMVSCNNFLLFISSQYLNICLYGHLLFSLYHFHIYMYILYFLFGQQSSIPVVIHVNVVSTYIYNIIIYYYFWRHHALSFSHKHGMVCTCYKLQLPTFFNPKKKCRSPLVILVIPRGFAIDQIGALLYETLGRLQKLYRMSLILW